MTGTFPRKARPTQFTPEQLQPQIIPLLLILGKHDNLPGDPKDTERLARNIATINIDVLDSGHFMAIEQTQQVNSLIAEFPGNNDIRDGMGLEYDPDASRKPGHSRLQGNSVFSARSLVNIACSLPAIT